MYTYRITGTSDHWKIVTLDIQAASAKSAKAKFRKRVNKATGLNVESVSSHAK